MTQIVNPQPKSKDVDVSTKQSILAALAANKVSVKRAE
jgi:hypothetical protein